MKRRRHGLAGASCHVKGLLGFGKNSRIHTAKILRLSEDLPVVIVEIIDTPDRLEELFAETYRFDDR